MTEYLTEQEQVELLKKWIKEYSKVILAGILIALLIMTAWRYWQQRQIKMLSHASAIYDELLMTHAQNNSSATVAQAQKLYAHYPRTIYGQLAALTLARDHALKKNYAQAEKQLQWFLDHNKVAALKQIARIRLANIYIAQRKPTASINVLERVEDKNFQGLIDEVRGDAYLAMKNVEKARQKYQQALAEIPNAEVMRPLLQMKYNNLITNESAS